MLERRDAALAEELPGDTLNNSFTLDKEVLHRLILVSSASEEALYELQFQLAIFNFSRFILKDFDLNISKVDDSRNAVAVFDFENYEAAAWYLKSIGESNEIVSLMKQLKAFPIIISDKNFSLLRMNRTLDEYLMFRNTEQNEATEVDKVNEDSEATAVEAATKVNDQEK